MSENARGEGAVSRGSEDDFSPLGLAFGSNLGDRFAILRAARRRMLELLESPESSVKSAPIYESDPLDCEPGAGVFLNSVLECRTGKSPLEVLTLAKQVEAEFGRKSKEIEAGADSENGSRWTSRTLDVDLLYYGSERLLLDNLILPHPRMLERRFVLEPLSRIRPDLVLPGLGENTVGQHLEQLLQHGGDDGLKLFAEDWS